MKVNKTVYLIFCLLACFSSLVSAQEVYDLTIKNHLFYPDTLKVPAATPFIIRVYNSDDSVEEFESFDLNLERILGAGQTAEFHVMPLKPGVYDFYGEFHRQSATGLVVVE